MAALGWWNRLLEWLKRYKTCAFHARTGTCVFHLSTLSAALRSQIWLLCVSNALHMLIDNIAELLPSS